MCNLEQKRSATATDLRLGSCNTAIPIQRAVTSEGLSYQMGFCTETLPPCSDNDCLCVFVAYPLTPSSAPRSANPPYPPTPSRGRDSPAPGGSGGGGRPSRRGPSGSRPGRGGRPPCRG